MKQCQTNPDGTEPAGTCETEQKTALTALLRRQGARYPLMEPQDAVKLLYQRAFGGGHLLRDEQKARAWLREELSAGVPEAEPEDLGGGFSRLPLSLAADGSIPEEWLFRMFLYSAGRGGSEAAFSDSLSVLEALTAAGGMPFSEASLRRYLAEYRAAGCPMVRHSQPYRLAYRPAYRVVDSRFLRLLPLLKRWRRITPHGQRAVLALDGRCASGKTTAAELLSFVLSCPVVHTDDFFLPPPLRTTERYAEPGGNFHRERFLCEVIPFLSTGAAFSYGRFDCGHPSAPLRPVSVSAGTSVLVEGTYALHPALGRYADLTAFSDVSPAVQWERICRRDGSYAPVFRDRWIPLEEAYFSSLGIRSVADVLLP